MNRYTLDGRYGILLSSVGISIGEVLQKAHLPKDLFSRKNISLTQEEYFRLMESINSSILDEETLLKLSTAENIETFSPPIFAAFCSKNVESGIERLAKYKRLISPMIFITSKDVNSFTVELTTESISNSLPIFLVEMEFTFLINLIRIATKEHIIPLNITLQKSINNKTLQAYWGCEPKLSTRNTLTLSIKDAKKPFISQNDAMWDYFEPELRRRLSELEVDDSFVAKVRSALIELLPGGESGIEDVAKKLGISKRTLQRKLSEEKTTFQKQLNYIRELLAKHYIMNNEMTTDEIAYLLGYQDSNSFLRAFQLWTGMNISSYRKSSTLQKSK